MNGSAHYPLSSLRKRLRSLVVLAALGALPLALGAAPDEVWGLTLEGVVTGATEITLTCRLPPELPPAALRLRRQAVRTQQVTELPRPGARLADGRVQWVDAAVQSGRTYTYLALADEPGLREASNCCTLTVPPVGTAPAPPRPAVSVYSPVEWSEAGRCYLLVAVGSPPGGVFTWRSCSPGVGEILASRRDRAIVKMRRADQATFAVDYEVGGQRAQTFVDIVGYSFFPDIAAFVSMPGRDDYSKVDAAAAKKLADRKVLLDPANQPLRRALIRRVFSPTDTPNPTQISRASRFIIEAGVVFRRDVFDAWLELGGKGHLRDYAAEELADLDVIGGPGPTHSGLPPADAAMRRTDLLSLLFALDVRYALAQVLPKALADQDEAGILAGLRRVNHPPAAGGRPVIADDLLDRLLEYPSPVVRTEAATAVSDASPVLLRQLERVARNDECDVVRAAAARAGEAARFPADDQVGGFLGPEFVPAGIRSAAERAAAAELIPAFSAAVRESAPIREADLRQALADTRNSLRDPFETLDFRPTPDPPALMRLLVFGVNAVPALLQRLAAPDLPFEEELTLLLGLRALCLSDVPPELVPAFRAVYVGLPANQRFAYRQRLVRLFGIWSPKRETVYTMRGGLPIRDPAVAAAAPHAQREEALQQQLQAAWRAIIAAAPKGGAADAGAEGPATMRVPPLDARVKGELKTDGKAGPLAVSPDGSLVFVSANVLHVIDARAWTHVGAVALPEPVDALVVAPDGRRLYAIGRNTKVQNAGAVTAIGVTERRVLGTVKLPAAGRCGLVTADGRRLYVSCPWANAITEIDLEKLAATRDFGISFDLGKTAEELKDRDRQLKELEAKKEGLTDHDRAAVAMSLMVEGAEPSAIVFGPGEKSLFVQFQRAALIGTLDLGTGKVEPWAPLGLKWGGGTAALTPNGKEWLLLLTEGLRRISLETRNTVTVSRFAAGNEIHPLVSHPDHQRFYVGLRWLSRGNINGGGVVLARGSSSLRPEDGILTGGEVTALALSPDGTVLYATTGERQTVCAIEAAAFARPTPTATPAPD